MILTGRQAIVLPNRSKYRLVQIECEATFDKSSANLNNPDPTKAVRWGDQTDDEMMIGYFDIVVPVGESSSSDTIAVS